MTSKSDGLDLDRYFVDSCGIILADYGYDSGHKRFFANYIQRETFGCVGFTSFKSKPPLCINVLVGVRFERVERVYDAILKPLVPNHVIPGQLSKFTPTVFTNLMRLSRNDKGGDTRRQLVTLSVAEGNVDRLLVDVARRFVTDGLSYIASVNTLHSAAEQLLNLDALSPQYAAKLPIMLKSLQRNEDAERIMSLALVGRPPMANFDEFCRRLRHYFDNKYIG